MTINVYSETFLVFYHSLLNEGKSFLSPEKKDTTEYRRNSYHLWNWEIDNSTLKVIDIVMSPDIYSSSYWNDIKSAHNSAIKKEKAKEENNPEKKIPTSTVQVKPFIVALNFLGYHLEEEPKRTKQLSEVQIAQLLYEKFLRAECGVFLSENNIYLKDNSSNGNLQPNLDPELSPYNKDLQNEKCVESAASLFWWRIGEEQLEFAWKQLSIRCREKYYSDYMVDVFFKGFAWTCAISEFKIISVEREENNLHKDTYYKCVVCFCEDFDLHKAFEVLQLGAVTEESMLQLYKIINLMRAGIDILYFSDNKEKHRISENWGDYSTNKHTKHEKRNLPTLNVFVQMYDMYISINESGIGEIERIFPTQRFYKDFSDWKI